MQFSKYQHIERVGSEEVEGLLIGTCYIFYKIDGTNGQVYKNSAGEIECGSRNKVLDAKNTNAGFYNYVMSDPRLKAILDQHPDLKLVGEWLVPHSLRTYHKNAWNKFYIFDVLKEEDGVVTYLPYPEYKEILDQFELDYIPPICYVKNPSEETLINLLEKTGEFLVEDGKGLGEGIVIKNYDYRNKYGRQTWGKIVRNEFKEKHKKAFEVNEIRSKMEVEFMIVEDFVTEALVLKELHKIKTETGYFEGKHIPRLLGTVFFCLITEEGYNFIKKFKFPVIDYNKLRKYCEVKTKEYMTGALN